MTKPLRISSREAILEAALQVLARNPAASLGTIAEAAGVGRATLHRHFASRQDLMRELALMSIREIDDAVSGLVNEVESATELLRRLFEAIVPLGDRFHFLAREGAVDDPDIDRELERQYAELAATVEAAKGEGSLDGDVPTAWIVYVIDALIYAAWSAMAAGDIARRQAPELSFRTLVSGMAPATGGAS